MYLKSVSKSKLIMLIVAASLAISACTSRTVVESDMGIKGAPKWVNEGSQAFKDDKTRFFRGVGSAPKMPDGYLQKSTADNRARAEVAQIFSSYMNLIASDYSGTLTDGTDIASEQAVSRTLDTITKLNLIGVEIIAHWKDKNSGMVYSLAEFDMKNFKSVSGVSDKMSAELSKFIDKEAGNIFDTMNTGSK